jgi:hypothetical protein
VSHGFRKGAYSIAQTNDVESAALVELNSSSPCNQKKQGPPLVLKPVIPATPGSLAPWLLGYTPITPT